MHTKLRHILIFGAIVGTLSCADEPSGPTSRERGPPPDVKYSLTAGNYLRSQIENAPNGATITLDSPVYTLDAPINITNKDDLTIVGLTASKVIQTTSNFQGVGVFHIGSDVHRLTIHRMTIRGTEPDNLNLTAIYTIASPYPQNISALTFQELTIENLGQGIAISGNPAVAGCDNVTMFGNKLTNINARVEKVPDDPPNQADSVWSTTGSGYGLQTSDCTRVRIANNHLEQTDRHAIYVGHGPGPVTIEHNLMLNHFMGESSCGYRTFPLVDPFDCVQLTPLHIARTNNVYAAFNIIANPYTHAIGIHQNTDVSPAQPATGIQLIGNIVVGRRSGHKDIHLGNPETHDVWGNRYYKRGTVGPILTPEIACEVGACSESSLRSPSGQWANTQWIDSYEGDGTSIPGFVIVRKGDQLHKLGKAYGTLPDSWTYATGSASHTWTNFHPWGLTSGMKNAFPISADRLAITYPTKTAGWWVTTSPGDWSGVEAMTYLNGYVYLVKGGTLLQVNDSNFSIANSYSGWGGTQALFAARGWLYLFINDCLYRIDPVSLTNAPTSTMNGPNCWT